MREKIISGKMPIPQGYKLSDAAKEQLKKQIQESNIPLTDENGNIIGKVIDFKDGKIISRIDHEFSIEEIS